MDRLSVFEWSFHVCVHYVLRSRISKLDVRNKLDISAALK